MSFFKNIMNTIWDNLSINEPDAWVREAEKGYQKFFDNSDAYINREKVPDRYYKGRLLEGWEPVFTEKWVEKTEDFSDSIPDDLDSDDEYYYYDDDTSDEEERERAADEFRRRREEEDEERLRRQREDDERLLFSIVMNEEDPNWDE